MDAFLSSIAPNTFIYIHVTVFDCIGIIKNIEDYLEVDRYPSELSVSLKECTKTIDLLVSPDYLDNTLYCC